MDSPFNRESNISVPFVLLIGFILAILAWIFLFYFKSSIPDKNTTIVESMSRLINGESTDDIASVSQLDSDSHFIDEFNKYPPTIWFETYASDLSSLNNKYIHTILDMDGKLIFTDSLDKKNIDYTLYHEVRDILSNKGREDILAYSSYQYHDRWNWACIITNIIKINGQLQKKSRIVHLSYGNIH
jgi:hypothetical protein